MSKPAWDGPNAKELGKALDKRHHEMARLLLDALARVRNGNKEAATDLIQRAMQLNLDVQEITQLMADGKPEEALQLISRQLRARNTND